MFSMNHELWMIELVCGLACEMNDGLKLNETGCCHEMRP